MGRYSVLITLRTSLDATMPRRQAPGHVYSLMVREHHRGTEGMYLMKNTSFTPRSQSTMVPHCPLDQSPTHLAVEDLPSPIAHTIIDHLILIEDELAAIRRLLIEEVGL